MTTLIIALRIISALGAAGFLFAALLSLSFLPDAAEGYDREPEDWWLSIVLAVLAALFAILNLANAAMIDRRGTQRALLVAANLLATIFCIALVIVAQDDPLAVLIAATALLNPCATLLYLAGSHSLKAS